MNVRLLAITTVLLLVISGCGQSYNPERDKDCPGCDLIGVQLENANLSGADLAGANLRGASLSYADFTGANLAGTGLSEAKLYEADLTGANLSEAIMYEAYLPLAKLSMSNLTGANLLYAYLSHADLSGADLTGANLSGADLTDANLYKANLTKALITRAHLAGAPMDGAALTADLSRANLTKAILTEAHMVGALLTGADLTDADLTDAHLYHADLTGAELSRANLTRIDLTETFLTGADLTGANLTGANLLGADLTDADLTGANLSGAGLERANLHLAILAGANLAGANLSAADLSGANLTGANLTGANLGWADLYGPGTIAMTAANLDDIIGADFTGALNVPVTQVPPTATPVPPTATPVPPTATPVPPTATPEPTPTPNIMLRVVGVTTDWMPFASTDGWTQAVPLKKSDVLKYLEVAIWEETSSVHLYAFPNDYDASYGVTGNPTNTQKVAYREQFQIKKYTDMPPIGDGTEARSTFLKNAFMDISSYLVEQYPDADHHLMYSGHGGPGGALFAAQLLNKDAYELLDVWTQSLGRPLGVIDMGGPCNKGSFADLDNFCKFTRYYVASDLPNGGFTMDDWTEEKYWETEAEVQYHNLLAANDNLEKALRGRVNLRRTSYEYSRDNIVSNRVAQANYLYSCSEFVKFSPAFISFLAETGADYNLNDDLYQFMIDNKAPSPLFSLYEAVLLYGVNNKDFFEWSTVANGMLMPSKY